MPKRKLAELEAEDDSEREATGSEREVTGSEREVTGSEREVTGSEREVTSSERQVTGSEREITCSEHEVTSSEQEVAGSEREATSSVQEATSSELEVTGSEREVTGSYQEATGSYCEATGSEREMTVSASEREATSSASEREATGSASEREATSSEREATASEDSNSSVHTNSSTDVPTADRTTTTGRFSHMHHGTNRRVKFKGVTVFYFQRKQGFVCVPSQGGSTLGMGEEHMTADSFSIREFARHQRQLHLDILAQQRGAMGSVVLRGTTEGSTGSSNGDSESSASSEDELNVDDYYFLQPVPTRQRRLMLRQAGIKKIDTLEKEECKDIRSSRESCGCDCRVFCEPETCACSLAGIKCQVDRLSFPCGCSKDGCGNVSGRIEFNPIRVRTHFIHTLMRLEMDRKQEEEQELREQRQREQGPARPEASPVCPELVTDPDPPRPRSPPGAQHLTLYNSNERGSCCDCQNSDIHKFMLHESQFNGGGNTVGSSLQPGTSAEYHTAPAAGVAQPAGAKTTDKAPPQVLLFNDSDDEYSGSNSTTLYPFTKDDTSYSESSDCSSDASISDTDNTTPSAFGGLPGTAYTVTGSGDAPPGAGFCLPPAATSLPDPSASYKLEPISEILNPVRFPPYGPGTVNPAWGMAGDAYPGFPCAGSCPYAGNEVGSKSQSEYVAYPVDTSRAGLVPVLPPAGAHLPDQYLEPACDLGRQNQVGRAEAADGIMDTGSDAMEQEEALGRPKKSYHDLTTSPFGQSMEAAQTTVPTPLNSTLCEEMGSLSPREHKVATSPSDEESATESAGPSQRGEVVRAGKAMASLGAVPMEAPCGQSQTESASSKLNGVCERSCGGEEKRSVCEAGAMTSKFEEMVTDSLETLSA